jgi:hypothetical protein
MVLPENINYLLAFSLANCPLFVANFFKISKVFLSNSSESSNKSISSTITYYGLMSKGAYYYLYLSTCARVIGVAINTSDKPHVALLTTFAIEISNISSYVYSLSVFSPSFFSGVINSTIGLLICNELVNLLKFIF